MTMGALGPAIAVLLVLFVFFVGFVARRIEARKGAPAPVPRPAWVSAPSVPAGVRESIDLRQSLRLMSQTHGPTLQGLEIRLDLVLPDEPLRVFAVPEDLQNLLGEIVDMAACMLQGGAALQVLARVDGHHAVINWRDTGDESPCLARAFDGAGGTMASRALSCQAIAARYGARIYAAPSPLGDRSITLRFPIHGPRKTPESGVRL
ncbi:hypothetical protein AB4Z46_02180 [Variovorax sp. M-6]|uniref:hypothetical protein n=1 Tax=Variovorax sp. M-6 TaxID=3233041 RepID=UPI003F99045C